MCFACNWKKNWEQYLPAVLVVCVCVWEGDMYVNIPCCYPVLARMSFLNKLYLQLHVYCDGAAGWYNECLAWLHQVAALMVF